MTTNINSNQFMTDYGSFMQNPGLPDAHMPTLNETSIDDLIGDSGAGLPDDIASNYTTSGIWNQAEYDNALNRGDGNAAVAYIVKALKEGAITPEFAKELARDVQKSANEAGGGKINGEMRNALKEALGTDTDHIGKGKTRPQMGLEKVLKTVFHIFTLGVFGAP